MTPILLEYNAESGIFHWNMPDSNGRFWDEPNTFGWDAIAYTYLEKARIFCNAIQCKNHRRKHQNLSPYTSEHIRKEWKLFCFIYNSIVSNLSTFSDEADAVDKNFSDTRSLARLGNGHFSDHKEDNDFIWAWEYNPLSYKDSNFD